MSKKAKKKPHGKPKPKCPRCKTSALVTVNGVSGDTAWCGRCSALFDAVDPNEGSNVFNDPTKRIEVMEAARAKRYRSFR